MLKTSSKVKLANKYKLIIFDVDGTLLDTSEGIISSVKYTLKQANLNLPSDFDYSVFIGPPVQRSFLEIFHLNKDDADKLALIFRDQYKNVDLCKAKPYPYLYEALEHLKAQGFKLAVATYKREDYARQIVDHFDISKYCEVVHGSDFAGKLSKADIIELCIKECGFTNKDALMVGDTVSDSKAAKEKNVDFMEVTFGFGFSQTNPCKEDKVYTINSFKDLLN